jgi:hypothetical protein
MDEHTQWREQCLLSAGFARVRARTLAGDPRIDVHALLELTDRGCPPELAERIVAPLEPDPQPR